MVLNMELVPTYGSYILVSHMNNNLATAPFSEGIRALPEPHSIFSIYFCFSTLNAVRSFFFFGGFGFFYFFIFLFNGQTFVAVALNGIFLGTL